MANATLTGANVTFHTNDDDKDYNTSLTVNVLLGETRVAGFGGVFAKFGNNSDAGPFALLVHNPAITRDELLKRGGAVLIYIAPSGNDTWRFNFLVDLVFSDGAHLISRANGVELTQDSREQRFGIE
jgi:hypothetical protein